MADPADILKALEEIADQLVNAVRDVSDELARVKPAPDRWSVLDNVEHLVLVEDRYWKQIGEARTGNDSFFDSTRAERYIGEYKSRSVTVQAPDAVLPTGRYATLHDAVAAFRNARKRTADLVRARGRELETLVVSHRRYGGTSRGKLLFSRGACYAAS